MGILSNELRLGNYVYDDEDNVVEISRLETEIYTDWNSGNGYSVVFKKLYIEGYFYYFGREFLA